MRVNCFQSSTGAGNTVNVSCYAYLQLKSYIHKMDLIPYKNVVFNGYNVRNGVFNFLCIILRLFYDQVGSLTVEYTSIMYSGCYTPFISLPGLAPSSTLPRCPFPRPVSLVVLFNQSHSCDHWIGTIHWSLLQSPVGYAIEGNDSISLQICWELAVH